ncbi:LOB domain-containing protein 1-like [Apium graveolens]|uniref:LOB domain-containing protein 1-like n=1 Tax=Apium graveolens TaxID=4045 RepID=UPI003D7BDA77
MECSLQSNMNVTKPLLYLTTSSSSQTYLNNSSTSSDNNNNNNSNSNVLASATAIMSPCAACKILRRRCVEKCVLAPYFPPTDPVKFTIAHRVFGASNIIKLLQELPESQRADAVSSMVYEANARVRDPVYGCAGAICHLQKQVSDLQAELAKAHAEIVNMQCQQANLLTLICMDMSSSQPNYIINQDPLSMITDVQQPCENLNFFPDLDVNLSSILEPLIGT